MIRALRVVAPLEGISFAVLLLGSLLKRTTDLDLVPVLGPLHGALYLALVVLALASLDRLRWSWWFLLLMLSPLGSPGFHFPLRRTRTG